MNPFPHNHAGRALPVALALILASAPAANGQAVDYPNPQYPNHKPLRGNYPGSYTATTPSQQPDGGFDWLASGVGATGMLGLILLFAAGKSATRSARNRRHRIPFVVDVRDDTPTTG